MKFKKKRNPEKLSWASLSQAMIWVYHAETSRVEIETTVCGNNLSFSYNKSDNLYLLILLYIFIAADLLSVLTKPYYPNDVGDSLRMAKPYPFIRL